MALIQHQAESWTKNRRGKKSCLIRFDTTRSSLYIRVCSISPGVMIRSIAVVALLSLLALSPICCGEKIKVLMAGHIDLINSLRVILAGEPLVSYVAVPCRLFGVVTHEAAMKFIRLYFPRTYEEMGSYGVVLLASPEYNLFTPKQDQWIYDAICDGAGGINDGSVFSIHPQIHCAWSDSLASKAFPNNARAVSNKGGGEAGGLHFRVIINRDFPDPILTPFVPYGVEKVECCAASRLVIPREGVGILAWQIGNFPVLGKVPYLVAWDYDNGRTMTSGDLMGNGWFGCPRSPTSNQYSPDILLNMFLHLTKRRLIEDVLVFHNARAQVAEFRSRMIILISVRDFIDKFGANTKLIQDGIVRLEEIYRQGADHYMSQEFRECQDTMNSALRQFSEVEEVAIKEKNAALFWIYLVEWLAVTGTGFVCAFVLWSVMVRRSLYREVQVTKFREPR